MYCALLTNFSFSYFLLYLRFQVQKMSRNYFLMKKIHQRYSIDKVSVKE